MLALTYSTGMRSSELVRARGGHLHFEPPEADGPGGWVLILRGKGDRVREVTLLDEVVVSLQRYLTERGLPADRRAVDPGVYLIGRVDDLHARLRFVARIGCATCMQRARSGAGCHFGSMREALGYGSLLTARRSVQADRLGTDRKCS